MTDNNFYVYEHWRPDKGTCFYVGKGSGVRAYDLVNRNDYHRRITAELADLKMTVDIRIISSNLSEADALVLESSRINEWRAGGTTLANAAISGEWGRADPHNRQHRYNERRRAGLCVLPIEINYDRVVRALLESGRLDEDGTSRNQVVEAVSNVVLDWADRWLSE